jgi:hypothetical protein
MVSCAFLCSCTIITSPLNQAEHHYKHKRYDKAIMAAQKSIDTNPSSLNTVAHELLRHASQHKLLSEYDDADNSFNPVSKAKK